MPAPTPEENATEQYNLLTADMFEAVSEDVIRQPAAQEMIRYFEVRFKQWVMKADA